MERFNRANESTVSVATVHTGFGNDISHSDPFSLMLDGSSCLAVMIVKAVLY
jgi:hypothetical protein